MKDWRALFDPDTLKNGENYYKVGKAKNLIEEPDLFEVTVRGSRNYKVRIISEFDDMYMWDEITGMQCTCDAGSK